MRLIKKTMLTCKEATMLVVKEQEITLTSKEKIRLKIHLMMCKLCSLFKKEAHFIDKNITHLHNSDRNAGQTGSFSAREKEKLEKLLRDKL
ncbi:MAG: hypothetical protein JKY48_09175 [Flavobacteriales bacterium]|nr:hypothetical protein [Flavobacteriales bacterium]